MRFPNFVNTVKRIRPDAGHLAAGWEAPSLIELERDRIPEICLLEKQCYLYPWSDELIAGEFCKDISLRLGLTFSADLAAYSFNYIVVDELHILNLAVNPGYRNLGYGRLLLAHVLTRAVSRGATFATLEVRRSNKAAQALYFSMGFVSTAVRRNYYKDNQEDAFILERNLSSAENFFHSNLKPKPVFVQKIRPNQ